jgi:hypothetical protein
MKGRDPFDDIRMERIAALRVSIQAGTFNTPISPRISIFPS